MASNTILKLNPKEWDDLLNALESKPLIKEMLIYKVVTPKRKYFRPQSFKVFRYNQLDFQEYLIEIFKTKEDAFNFIETIIDKKIIDRSSKNSFYKDDNIFFIRPSKDHPVKKIY